MTEAERDLLVLVARVVKGSTQYDLDERDFGPIRDALAAVEAEVQRAGRIIPHRK
jgi:hypothetical protein